MRAATAKEHAMEPNKRPRLAKDIVCGMVVDIDKSAASSTYDGKTFHFCSPGCKQKFDANPGGYVRGEIEQKM